MYVKEKRSHLSRKYTTNHLAIAKKYEQYTIDDWSHKIFSNDTKINIFSSNGRVWC